MLMKGRKLRNCIGIGILSLFASYFLIVNSCVSYDPNLYTGYDILNPSAEVRENPIAWVENGEVVNDEGVKVDIAKGVVVNEAFLLWVYELKEEIKKLRKK